MEDPQIIGLYFARSEDAIARTAEKYGAYCGAIASNILNVPEDTEECLSDTWLTAWQQMPPTVPACLRVFLGRITRNLAITRFRSTHAGKRGGGTELLLSELQECIPDTASVEQAVEQRLLSALISAWLDSLSTAERRLFVRRYWFGTPVRQLAAEAGVRPNLISQRLHRLRAMLKQYLEQEGFSI